MGGNWAIWHKEPKNLSEYFKSPIFTQRYELSTGAYLHFFFLAYMLPPPPPPAPFQFKYEEKARGQRPLLNQNGSCQNVETLADDTLPPSAASARGQRLPSTKAPQLPVTSGEPPDSVFAKSGKVPGEE